jgi:hypothetical protein
MTTSYESKCLQDLSEFDRIAQNLDKFAQSVNQNKTKTIVIGNRTILRIYPFLNDNLRINKENVN